MEFGRVGPSEPGGSSRRSTAPLTEPNSSSSSKSKKKLILLSVLAAVLIVASAISAALVTVIRSRARNQNAPNLIGKPTEAISRTCSKTRFPTLCINSLLDFPGSTTASEQDLIHISFNMTLSHVSRAFYDSTGISFAATDPLLRSAYDDCLELLDDSIDALARSLASVVPPSEPSGAAAGSTDDVMTWLSTALTNQDTCAEGLDDTSGSVKDQMVNNLKDLSELVSNCLAIFSASGNGDFSGVPIQNRRRLMRVEEEEGENFHGDISGKFPRWLNKRDRRLLSLPISAIQADIIVSKNGNGTVKTIAEAIKKAPEHSKRRFIIYVRAGR